MNQDTNTEHKNGKTGRIIAVVVAVLVIGALVVGSAQRKKNAAPTPEAAEGCKPGYLFSEVTGKPCPATTEPLSVEGEKATTEASGYEAAVAQYAGKLIVVDSACVATPNALTVGANTRILIGNNSSQAQTLALGDRSETLDGYHYFTYSLKSGGEMKLSCNGADVATITVTEAK